MILTRLHSSPILQKMSSFVNHFSVFQDFSQEFKQNIKLFHVFEYITYCVTNDDKVYGFRENICEYLGYNQNNDNKSYVLIQELCDKRIEEFFGNFDAFFARTVTNEIYSWGMNFDGELGRGYRSEQKLKPEKSEILSELNLIKINFDGEYCSALSSDGDVYGWGCLGYKEFGAITSKTILTPIKMIKLDEMVKSIQCSYREIFALTLSGRVFSYTKDKYLNWEIPGEVIMDLFHENGDNFCQTNESLYERRDENWIKIDYKNPFEYYFLRHLFTYKTIHLGKSEKFFIDFCFDEQSNEMKKRLEIIDFNESKLTISSDVFKDLPKTLKSEVKCFYKSDYFEFIIMNDNKVFGQSLIGYDYEGNLGLGDIKECPDFIEIPGLSGILIEEFFEGYDSMFARTETNEIYSWGMNERGQLGRGFQSDKQERFKPQKNEYFSNKNIIKISCHRNHSLALSSNGKVYGWGHNGSYFSEEEWCGKTLVPMEIQFEYPIKYITGSAFLSFAIDINGNAFYWGKSLNEIQWKANKMNVNNVKKIQNFENQCIVLKESGKVFVYSFDENLIIFEIIVGLKVNDIFKNLCQTEECVYQLEKETKVLKKTNFINFYDYSPKLKTIHVKTEENNGQVVKYLTNREIQLNPEYNRQTNEELLVFKDNNVFDRKFHNSFEIIGEKIGEGSFGEVFRVKEIRSQDIFAIKRIEMRGDINFITLYQLIIFTILQINGNTI